MRKMLGPIAFMVFLAVATSLFAAGDWVLSPLVITPALREFTITGLVPGDAVTVRVTAFDALGIQGPVSDPAAEVLIVNSWWGERPVPGWTGLVKVGTELCWTWTAATGTVALYRVESSKWKPPIAGCGKTPTPALK